MDCMLCGLHVVWTACCVDCMLCGVHVVWTACCVDCMLCGLHVVWTACCVDCMLCLLLSKGQGCKEKAHELYEDLLKKDSIDPSLVRESLSYSQLTYQCSGLLVYMWYVAWATSKEKQCTHS